MGKLAKVERSTATLFGGPTIEHYHQMVAVVVAETFEQARAAAGQVQIDYETAEGAFDLEAGLKGAADPKRSRMALPIRRSAISTAVGCRSGKARRHLHDARPLSRDDGAACFHRGMGWGRADRVDIAPDGGMIEGRPGRDIGDSPPRMFASARRLSMAVSAPSFFCALTCWRPPWPRARRAAR